MHSHSLFPCSHPPGMQPHPSQHKEGDASLTPTPTSCCTAVLGRTTAQGGCTHPIRSRQQAAHLAQHEDYRRPRLSVMTAHLTYRNAHRPAYPYISPLTAACCLQPRAEGFIRGFQLQQSHQPAGAVMHCPWKRAGCLNQFMQVQQFLMALYICINTEWLKLKLQTHPFFIINYIYRIFTFDKDDFQLKQINNSVDWKGVSWWQ